MSDEDFYLKIRRLLAITKPKESINQSSQYNQDTLQIRLHNKFATKEELDDLNREFAFLFTDLNTRIHAFEEKQKQGLSKLDQHSERLVKCESDDRRSERIRDLESKITAMEGKILDQWAVGKVVVSIAVGSACLLGVGYAVLKTLGMISS